MRSETILKHAGERIPRYTSYPTAPHFSPDIGAEAYTGWLNTLDPDEPVSLYLHIPFCRTMCWYCGCHTKATRRVDPVTDYAQVLVDEIDLLADHLPARMRVSHIHWGGGSPTYLPAVWFETLMERIRNRFSVIDKAEIAVEVDPRIFSAEMAVAFRATGVNRASLGVQTFDPDVQQAVNRVQDRACVSRCVDILRSADIGRLNFDLLYGLPFQTSDNCRSSAQAAIEFAPDRFSVFGYAHVPHMKPHQSMIRDQDLPGAAERLAQADVLAETLRAAGYVQIGLDHFARSDDAMTQAMAAGSLRRNFQGYTTDSARTILGLGASSIGWLPQGYVQNTPRNHEWERSIRAGVLPTARGYLLSADDRLRRDVIEELMCTLSVDPVRHAAAHNCDLPLPDLSRFERDGVIRRDGNRITLQPDYRPLLRSVAAAFDAYLPSSTARHAAAV